MTFVLLKIILRRTLAIWVVDPIISGLNKKLTFPIEDVPTFKDSIVRHFEALLKALFALASPALQQASCHVNLPDYYFYNY